MDLKDHVFDLEIEEFHRDFNNDMGRKGDK